MNRQFASRVHPAYPLQKALSTSRGSRQAERGRGVEGLRRPSRRNLATTAAEFGVNRQTVRAALQQLREQGLVSTDRRGTRAARADSPAAPALAGPATGYGAGLLLPAMAVGTGQSSMFAAPVSATLARLLGVPAGRPVLVHRHRVLTATGEPYGDALTSHTRRRTGGPRTLPLPAPPAGGGPRPTARGSVDRPRGPDPDRDPQGPPAPKRAQAPVPLKDRAGNGVSAPTALKAIRERRDPRHIPTASAPVLPSPALAFLMAPALRRSDCAAPCRHWPRTGVHAATDW
ncbi:GntR family transcriptional regulator [Streptomyces sp. NPDC059957]|uniref:GntR family transcriptional regulator n=1 Tax=unclassified Streptomyces TaxID=2593676 RepID=UPI0036693F93